MKLKITYDKQQDNGTVKKVSEMYLVDAMSCTEAEARVVTEREHYIAGVFAVSAAKKSRIAEIFYGDESKWWLVKWTITEVAGTPPKEKKITVATLVQGASLPDALNCFTQGMKGTIADYEITSISESPIIDVYPIKLNDNDAE